MYTFVIIEFKSKITKNIKLKLKYVYYELLESNCTLFYITIISREPWFATTRLQ